MEYELNHFDSIGTQECKVKSFYSVDSLNLYLEDLVDDHETVYLLSYHYHIFVDEDFNEIMSYLNAHIYDDFFNDSDIKEVHLQHYDSYESAYSVALDIMEGISSLTYAPDNKDFKMNNSNTTFSIN